MIRWLRRPRTPDPVQPETDHDDTSKQLAEARRAREASEQGLAEVCDRWPEVNRLGAALRRHREENHFLELFEQAMRGGGGDPARG